MRTGRKPAPKRKYVCYTKKQNKMRKTNCVLLVHKGKRFMFTETEYNKAWLRAKKYSGLD